MFLEASRVFLRISVICYTFTDQLHYYKHGEKYIKLINGSYDYINIAHDFVNVPIPFFSNTIREILKLFFFNFYNKQVVTTITKHFLLLKTKGL